MVKCSCRLLLCQTQQRVLIKEVEEASESQVSDQQAVSQQAAEAL